MKKEIANRKDIETSRLVLKPSSDERDRDNYIRHLKEEDIFFYQYGEPYSEELENLINFHSSGVIYYSIFLKDEDIMAGYVGILPYSCEENTGELEYYIFPEFRRNGYASEAIMCIIDEFLNGEMSALGIRRILAETIFENEASKELLMHLGFKKEAVGIRLYPDESERKTYGTIVYVYGDNSNENYEPEDIDDMRWSICI